MLFRSTIAITFLAFQASGCVLINSTQEAKLAHFLGSFSDDYNSTYVITPDIWVHDDTYRYHILEWDPDSTFIIARNDGENPADQNLFTRIDYVAIDMPPYSWAYCLSTYDSETPEAASEVVSDTSKPRDGCNGFPFTRMRPAEVAK